MIFAMRVSLPDQPGMLGAMATALSRGGANIITLDVVDRGEGIAVDDLCVEAPEGLTEALRRAAEEVPGAVVEAIRPLETVRDVLSPMELATALVDTEPGDVMQTFVKGLPKALWSTWCVALRAAEPHPAVLASSAGAPSLTNVETPWLPLDDPRRFAHALWMPPAWRMGRFGYEAAAAPLGHNDEAVLLVRRFGPRFRPSELRQLGFLARMAVRVRTRVYAESDDVTV
ncbi:MAG: amino acid-binding protein [Actinomycetota bacterium]